MKFINEIKRTHYCGQLNKEHVGKEVVVMGWVDTRRDHGGLVFVDLRDRYGILQVVLDPSKEKTSEAHKFRNEFVIAVRGQLRARPQGMENKNLATGEVELEAEECEILSVAKTPPFVVDDPNVNENTRLKYRYLDLRTAFLQNNLKVRHDVCQVTRNYLSNEGFLEVETPILYKSTPEGARDFLVPSRISQGDFYALPQSPQTLKQLLMIGGYDRYFQVCRCFRDEDLRANRQPEFSQIDIELSFVGREDVMQVLEGLVREIWQKIKGVDIGEIPRISYAEAMNRYGVDRPDLRFGMELKDLNDYVKDSGFRVFDDVVSRGGAVKAIAVPGQASLSRSQIDKLTDEAKQLGAKGLLWIKWEESKISSPVSKFFDENKLKSICEVAGAKQGDLVLIVADNWHETCSVLSHLRLRFGHELKLIDTNKDAFTWVVDFPLFEYSSEERRWVARHHPFTMPKKEFLNDLSLGDESKYNGLLADAYDLVCNGEEVCGGSVRVHDFNTQRQIFKALGLSEKETEEKFGFFIEALQYGTPPHAGAAWGLDRLVMLLCGTDAIRDVIAFPKTAKAQDLMADCPGPVAKDQLMELGLRLNPSLQK